MRSVGLTVMVIAVGLAGCLDSTADAPLPAPEVEEFATEGPFDVLGLNGSALDAVGQTRNVTFRLFNGTGNCCENYVMTSATGRIMDFGGTFIWYTDDEGQTWETVGTTIPYRNGEGAIANAPGGDIVGVGWDPYSGDQAWAHKYDNATGEWSYMPMPIHAPFWDREWVVSVPGPFTFDGTDVPYISIARGGWPYKDTLLVSGDGLEYITMSVPALDAMMGTLSLPALDVGPDGERDWLQPATETLITPVDDRLAIARFGGCDLVLDEELTWKCLELTEATLPPGRLLVDSIGALHLASVSGDTLTYRISHDGGRHWESQDHSLPDGWRSLTWDYKANAGLDQTIIAIHADTGDGALDHFYRFSNLTGVPVLDEIVYAGQPGGETDSGVTAQGGRYDFMTVALLPDGRAVLSVSGDDLPQPTLAVELAR